MEQTAAETVSPGGSYGWAGNRETWLLLAPPAGRPLFRVEVAFLAGSGASKGGTVTGRAGEGQ